MSYKYAASRPFITVSRNMCISPMLVEALFHEGDPYSRLSCGEKPSHEVWFGIAIHQEDMVDPSHVMICD